VISRQGKDATVLGRVKRWLLAMLENPKPYFLRVAPVPPRDRARRF
jgi:hypothetical protein